MSEEKPKLAVFFSLGTGLEVWRRSGILEREIALFKTLAPSFSEITFLTYGRDPGTKQEVGDIRVRTRPSFLPSKAYSLLMPFARGHDLRQAAVLKTMQMPGSWAAAIAKRVYRKPLIVRCGYEWYMQEAEGGAGRVRLAIIDRLQGFCYRSADAIVTTTAEMAEFIVARYAIPRSKMVVIPNFVDTSLFFPPPSRAATPRQVAFVGRLTAQKNLHALISAVAKHPSLRLAIVGDGPLRDDLEQHARLTGADVEFLGRLRSDEVATILRASDIFAFPTLFEGHPKALLEAMATGLPVVTTPVQGNRQVIRHRDNGFMLEGTDERAIAAGLGEIVGDNRLRKLIGDNAALEIRGKMSLAVVSAKEECLIKALASGSSFATEELV
jgi:glycosyltransferase involved in cell wall biosynthesis